MASQGKLTMAPGEAQTNQVSGEMQGSLQGKLGSRLAEKQIGNLSFPRGSEVGEQVCTEVFRKFLVPGTPRVLKVLDLNQLHLSSYYRTHDFFL